MGKSTENILLPAVDNIVNSMDSGVAVCATFLDFRKAFDSRPLYIVAMALLFHLYYYGLRVN